jgi:hypothetical protein
MQKENVSHNKAKVDKMVRKSALPCVRRSRLMYSVQVVRSVVLLSIKKKK